MKAAIVVLSILLCSVYSAAFSVRDDAEECTKENCTGSCRCSSTDNPLGDGEAPQLISLTFDEAVVDNLFTSFWYPLLFNRTNPDGAPIGATFFVPHEYTDYSRVQELYVRGFEIAVNSITKNSLSEYWSSATKEVLVEEFAGQREIISIFAKIPKEDIIGARTPQLQLQGDVSIAAYEDSDIQYDSSWTSRSTEMIFPYTLDYKSTQECRTGTTCPKEAHAGFWVAPIIDLQGNSTDGNVLECNSLIGCNIQGTAQEISDWLLEQVQRERDDNKAPITLMVSSSWFRFTDNSYEGFSQFLDTLQSQNDVFLVSQKQVVDWAKNPVPLSDFKTEVPERTADCNKISCKLTTTDNDTRYMTSCVACPEVYPWLGNPSGSANPTTAPTPTTQTTVTTTTQSTTPTSPPTTPATTPTTTAAP